MPKSTLSAAPGAELPLTPVKRDKMEGDLLQWLTKNNCVAGGLMFCARTEKFVMLKLTKDVEDLMPHHCDTLRVKSRDLGKRRSETMPIYHKDDLGASYARVFTRVLKGCTDAQIAAALKHLNDQMANCPSEKKFCKYDELATLCRDVLVPGFKMFTRKTKYKPWSWFPILNQSPIATLADLVVDGDISAAIDVSEEMAAAKKGYPPIELVRKDSEADPTASTSGTIVRTKDDNQLKTLNTGDESELKRQDEVPQKTNSDVQGQIGEDAKTDDFPNDDDVLLSQAEEMEKEVQPHVVADENSAEHASAQPKVQPKVHAEDDRDGQREQAEGKSSRTGSDDDNVKEPVQDAVAQATEDANVDANVDVDEVPDPNVEGNDKRENTANKPMDVATAFTEINDKPPDGLHDEIDVISELPVDKLPAGHEAILSGNIGGPNIEDVDDNDTRPLSLRRLQSMLPKNEEAIPDPTSDRLNFTRLVYELRPYLVEHYTRQHVKVELEPVSLTRLLNLRQCSKELKRILQLMEERDMWITERREQARVKRHQDNKFRNTLKGRKLEKKKIENEEFERLRNKGPPITSTQINVTESRSKNKPSTMQRNMSTASSSSNVERPLITLLGRHSQPRTSDYASNEAGDGDRNVSVVSDVGDLSQILDIPDDKSPSFDGSFIRPGKTARTFVKTDTLRVMKDMYVLMQETMRIGQNRDKSNELVIKNVEKRLVNMEDKIDVMGQQMRALSKAFFDYDLEANQQLLLVENELMKYFPLNELGEKTDFLLTDPICAKTITKHVKSSLFQSKTNVSELTEVVRRAASTCFSLELRAHMNLVKRKVKQSYRFAGWHYVKCPKSFQDLITNYMLCLCKNLNPTEKQRGWLARLTDHLRNSGTTYFNYLGTSTITQADYVKNRYYERRRLQDKHFDPDSEGRELLIPTIEQELEHYANKSQKCEEEDMDSSNKSQRSGKNDKNGSGKPLPDLAALVDLSKRINEAMKACSVARKGQKRKMALDHHGVDPGDSSDGTVPCPNWFPGKKLKYAWKGTEFESSSNDENANENADEELVETAAAGSTAKTPASTCTSGQAAAVAITNLVRPSKLSLRRTKPESAQSQP